jgi:serine phosphatase RsbU (regulator of sigma subunit)
MYSAEFEDKLKSDALEIQRFLSPIIIIFSTFLGLFIDREKFPNREIDFLIIRLFCVSLSTSSYILSIQKKNILISNICFIFSIQIQMAFSFGASHFKESYFYIFSISSILTIVFFPVSFRISILTSLGSLIFIFPGRFSIGIGDYLEIRFFHFIFLNSFFLFIKYFLITSRYSEFQSKLNLQKANSKIEELNQILKNENARLSYEMEVASGIQSALLPGEIENSSIETAFNSFRANENSGDYFDLLKTNNVEIICLGDVSGHGFYAGIASLLIAGGFRALTKSGETNIIKIYSKLNQILVEFRLNTKQDRLMSLIILKHNGNGEFVATGFAEDFLVYKKDSGWSKISFSDFGIELGLLENIEEYLFEKQIHLEKDEILFLFTDGFLEITNHNPLEFIKNINPENKSAKETLYEITSSLSLDKTKPEDDTSLLIIKIPSSSQG